LRANSTDETSFSLQKHAIFILLAQIQAQTVTERNIIMLQ